MGKRRPSAAAVLLATASLVLCRPASADQVAAKPPNTFSHLPFSEPTRTDLPPRVLFGDMHLHTDSSFDAGTFGTKLRPEDAFRFARGEEVTSTTGIPAKLRRPLDFLLVSDHSDYMGLPLALRDGDPGVLADPLGKKWYAMFHGTGEQRFGIFMQLRHDFEDHKISLKEAPRLLKSAWARNVGAAEKYN